MRFCPLCQTRTDSAICPVDDQPTERLADLDAAPDGAPGESDPLLAGYRLEHYWGSDEAGGMYRGVSYETGSVVAIRLVRADLSADAGYAAAFHHQAGVCRGLASHHVAKVIDFGRTSEGRLYLVTEYVSGQSLRQIIDNGEVFGWVRLREMTLQLLEGLAEGHRSGNVHWDLRPDAVWFDATTGGALPNVRLTQFGLPWWPPQGSAWEGGTRPSAYAAPERFAGGTVDARSDLYALGATLFHLLTGRPPVAGSDPAEIARALRSGKAARIQRDEVPKGIPDGFVHLIRYLMAWSPADRPWDAEEVTLMLTSLPVGDLDGSAAGEALLFADDAKPDEEGVIALGRPVVQREPSVIERVAGHRSARWAIAAVLLFAIIVLLALILFAPKKAPAPLGQPPSGEGQKARTVAMSVSPKSSITSRSTPSAMPAVGGTPTRSASR